ncbi:MAG: histidine kinase, partial [Saprospiraceae bacterium]
VLSQFALLLVKIPMVYALFYITEKYLAQVYGLGKSILAVIVLFILSVAVFLPVKQFLVIEIIYGTDTTLSAALDLASILSSLFILFFVCGMALSAKMVRMSFRQKERESEITKQRLQTELKYLKAQTNPHFLFNTLNNIYALARKKSDDTAGVVMKLSKLLRYMLYETQKKWIAIAEEINVLDGYIELEKIRYDDKLSIKFDKSVDNEHQQIAPLILLPFVEKAFKHGASESRFDSNIRIRLTLENAQLQFRVENSTSEESSKPNGENIGLVNIHRQLELLYPEHNLIIEQQLNKFCIALSINLSHHAAV